MWARPYIGRLPTDSVPWSGFPLFAPGRDLGGVLRVLSRDPSNGAGTCLWQIPSGWAHPGGFTMAGDEQLFVLEGEFHKGDHRYRPGCYGYRPAGQTHEAMRSPGGALLLAMWDSAPDLASMPGAHQVETGEGLRFVDTGFVPAVPTPVQGPPAGIDVKILNRYPDSGGMTMLITIPPGWEESRSEHHDCVEESFKLSGGIWIVENGREQVLCAGDYFFRPPRIKHGPMRTEGGTSSLIRFSARPENHYGPVNSMPENHRGERQL
ncbi:MAG: cupin domain-containing protein [Chromatiales bacterium]|nr:cupin domain-containing protein [Chromatiales bacterium]